MAFQHHTGSLASDLAAAVSAASMFAILRLFASSMIFKPLAKACLAQPEEDSKHGKLEYKKRKAKFMESCWKVLAYSSFTVLEVAVAWGQPWLTDPLRMWDGCTRIPCEATLDARLAQLYLLQVGFYSFSIPALLLWETRRKDFIASLGHHVVSLTLLLYSYALNFTVIGAMVLLLHDCCDVLLELTKALLYAKKQRMADAGFCAFVLLWFANRVFIFPLHTIRSTWYDSLALAAKYGVNPQPHHALFNSLLITIWLLQLYWSVLIARVLYKTICKSNELADDREDSDDD